MADEVYTHTRRRKSSIVAGQRIGMWTILGLHGHDARAHQARWICRCDCGTERPILEVSLRKARSTNCGCANRLSVESGKVYGQWRAVAPDKNSLPGKRRWICRCSCGTEKSVSVGHLVNGRSKNCGCVRKVTFTPLTHGATVGRKMSPEYQSWRAMIGRCTNQDQINYKNYGGRGITVCKDWASSFERFFADMGPRPQGMSLDRIDVDGPYSAANCRWANSKTQARNTRKNVYLTFNGRTLTVSEWALELGMPLPTLHARLRRGWTDMDALTLPVGHRGPRPGA